MSELFPPRTQKQSNPKQAVDEALRIMAAVGWGISPPPELPTMQVNLISFFKTISYIAHIVVVTSEERDCSWEEIIEAWLDGRDRSQSISL